MRFICLLVMCLLVALCCGEHGHDHDDHDHHHDHHDHDSDHGTNSWDWAGVFHVNASEEYTWVAMQKDGKYADAHMKILILPASNATSAAIHEAEHEAEEHWEGNATHAHANEVLVPSQLYELCFSKTKEALSLFLIVFSNASGDTELPFVIFTQHKPLEFENGIHYLLDPEGHAVKPMATSDEHDDEHDDQQPRVAITVLAACCVSLASFIGLVLILPGVKGCATRFNISKYLDAFASGALLALVFFLVLPESLLSIQTDMSGESETSSWFGSFVLLGFLFPCLVEWFITKFFSGHIHRHHGEHDCEEHGDAKPEGTTVQVQAQPETDLTSTDVEKPAPHTNDEILAVPVKKPYCLMNGICWAVFIGDGMHNFVDGVMIGVAFNLCSETMGWTVTFGAILHELAAELSEFWLLTDSSKGGLTWLQALGVNFVSSLTVILGAIIVSYSSVTQAVLGVLLAFGGGTLLYLGIVPIWHGLLSADRPTILHILVTVLCFVFGATVIGLVLLKHEHCHDHAHAHAGHAH